MQVLIQSGTKFLGEDIQNIIDQILHTVTFYMCKISKRSVNHAAHRTFLQNPADHSKSNNHRYQYVRKRLELSL